MTDDIEAAAEAAVPNSLRDDLEEAWDTLSADGRGAGARGRHRAGGGGRCGRGARPARALAGRMARAVRGAARRRAGLCARPPPPVRAGPFGAQPGARRAREGARRDGGGRCGARPVARDHARPGADRRRRGDPADGGAGRAGERSRERAGGDRRGVRPRRAGGGRRRPAPGRRRARASSWTRSSATPPSSTSSA